MEILEVKERAMLVRCTVREEERVPIGLGKGTVKLPEHKITVLIGVDSPMTLPFVTQVSSRLDTVAAAFDSLMPKTVRRAVEAGADVKRQGDWFFVPISFIFKRPDRQVVIESWDTVPKRSWREPVLKPNCLYSGYRCAIETRHSASGVRHRANGRPLVRGTVSAPDHEELFLDDWHVGIRRLEVKWPLGRVGAD